MTGFKTLLFFFFLFLSHSALSQSETNTPSSNDSTKVEYKKRGFLDTFDGEPGRAALYSLILPGGGQAYNKRYWKVPIALAAEGAVIWNIVSKRKNFKSLDSKWRYYLANDEPPMGCDEIGISIQSVKRSRDRARKSMEWSWVYWGLTHMVITLEAFINRHLMDFDISEDLSFKYKTDQNTIHGINYAPTVGLVYTFK